MKRSHACLVAVVAATAWAAPVAPPRATLPPGPLSLGEACDRIGRQLNRRFEGGLLEQPELAAKVTPWKLQDAPAATAFAVLEEAALCHVNRTALGTYALDLALAPDGSVVQRAGDLLVRLQRIDFDWQSWCRLTGRPAEFGPGTLTAQLTVEAPDDSTATRLVNLQSTDVRRKGPGGVPAVLPLDDRDPRLRSTELGLPAPPTPADRLPRLGLELQVATEVRGEVVEFTLPLTERQTRSAGAYQVTCEPPPRGAKLGAPDSVLVTVTPPEPGRGQPRRNWWAEPRLVDAAGQTVFADWERPANRPGRTPSARLFDVHRAEVDAAREPAKLEVSVWSPGEAMGTERVVFENLPLPPLADNGP